ncbi:MAG: M1 family metallopeptidase [Balneolaceae bacterium]|nr:M1 family metallopeptidase [Balneolaceae bacterium]
MIFIQISGELFADDYPRNHGIDIQHYTFSLALSDTSDTIVGETTVTVSFKKNGIQQFRLDLINSSKARDGRGMVVRSVKSGERVLQFTHNNDALVIHLPEPAASGEIVDITITYSGIPADGLRIGDTKYGDRSFFSNNWPNRARHWLPVIDHPYDKATSEFIVTAPLRYQVISNGLLKEETNLHNGDKLTHWKQSVPIPSWLFVLGVAEFAIQYVDEFRGKSVQSWVYPQDREIGSRNFAEPTMHSLRFFSEYIGPFAYEKLANIQSPSVGGGMEAATAVFYSENAIQEEQTPWLHNVIVHEVAHHWFGNAVTESTWDDAWLSEGFATYFTLLFREHAYGRDDFLNHLDKAKKRVFEYYSDHPEYKIVDTRSPETGPVTSLATYQKGAWILHMLRNLVGDPAFKKGIQSYYHRYMNSTASTDDFKFEMEQASGNNLDAYFNQWLYQGGNPVVEGHWSYHPEQQVVTVQLSQVQSKQYRFEFPVEFGIYYDEQILPDVATRLMDQQRMELKISVEEEPEEVVIDPHSKLLAKWNLVKK